ncbi:MAG: hypothetical protein PUD92_04215 [Clostridiales bacterium]|nr:hypothetical protein [Clostridiales bacterium]
MTRAELLQTAKPILFNTEMVRAILDGCKTATRRVIKPQPKNKIAYRFAGCRAGKWGYPAKDVHKYWGKEFKRAEQLTTEEENRCWTPPCHTGDILYVRETWTNCNIASPEKYLYKADYDLNIYPYCNWMWHPSIHMPKEAACIFLRVTGVRAERLQDITEKEALKEGISDEPLIEGGSEKFSALWQFPHIWDSTIPKKNRELYGWDANPWVWVIEFERLEAE